MNNVIYQDWTPAGTSLESGSATLHISPCLHKESVQNYMAAQSALPEQFHCEPKGLPVEVAVSPALLSRLEAGGGSLRASTLRLCRVSSGGLRVFDTALVEGGAFLDLVMAGHAKLGQVDDYIAQWHDAQGDSGISLPAHLGMDFNEYARFVGSPDALLGILFARTLSLQEGGYFRHLHTGGDYLVMAQGCLEATGAPVTVYLGVDGQVWVRDQAEFADGRFERLAPQVTALSLRP